MNNLEDILEKAKSHYKKKIDLRVFSAEKIPAKDNSQDIVILFEAIYYLKNRDIFISECNRVLKKGGKVLICSANKDLYDFNPSPYTHRYYNLPELKELFEKNGFLVEGFVSHAVNKVNLRQKILRPIKKIVVSLGLMPKSMKGKKFLKKIVFGKMLKMPSEIADNIFSEVNIEPASLIEKNRTHKVLYVCSTKK